MAVPDSQEPLVWHGYFLAALSGIFACLWPGPAGIGLALLLLFHKKLWSLSRFLVSLLFFFLSFSYAHWHFAQAAQIIAEPPAWANARGTRICATISSVQGLPDHRLRLVLNNLQTETGERLAGGAAWTWDGPALIPQAGEKVCLSRSVRPTGGFANFPVDSWAAQDIARGVYWRIWSKGTAGQPEFTGKGTWLSTLRFRLQQQFLGELGPDVSQPKAILVALLFGDRFYLQSGTIREFAQAALAHSLALSGQHLAIAWLAGFELVNIAGWLWPAIFLYKPRATLVFAVSVPLALLYLWLGNAPASLLRAFVMLLVLAIWQWVKASFTSMDLLWLAVALILIFNPLLTFDTGLQLSVLCVGTIIILWPGIVKLAANIPGQKIWGKAGRQILIIVLISFGIQLFLLPVNLLLFHQAGLWFVLNALWLPCVACITLPGVVLGLIVGSIPWDICHWVSRQILDMAALPGEGVLYILNCLKAHGWLEEPLFLIPAWPALFAFALIICGIANLIGEFPHKKRAKIYFIAALLFLSATPLLRLEQDKHIRIIAPDVGQGQAVIISLPDGKRLLVDGGGNINSRFDPGKSIIGPYLSRNHRPALTAVLNTHPDVDHLGGLFHILGKFSAEKVFHNGRLAADSLNQPWSELQKKYSAHTLVAGDRIILNAETHLEVLHPPAGETDWQGNDASLILRLVWREQGIALFTGDAGKDTLKRVLQDGRDIQAKLLFAPHHGSDRNLDKPFYKAARPELVVASCGRHNRWHYPGKRLREFLASIQVPLLDTGTSGKIEASISSKGELIVHTMRPAL